jgi:hypothetical protein
MKVKNFISLSSYSLRLERLCVLAFAKRLVEKRGYAQKNHPMIQQRQRINSLVANQRLIAKICSAVREIFGNNLESIRSCPRNTFGGKYSPSSS